MFLKKSISNTTQFGGLQTTLKKIFYWFIGETAGRSTAGIWKWFWGLPIEPGGKIARKVAAEPLQSMLLLFLIQCVPLLLVCKVVKISYKMC